TPSSNLQRQMTDRLARRLHLDFNIVTKAVQARHQLALGQVCEVAAQHGRDLGLGYAHATAGLLLRQIEPAQRAGDLDRQSGLDLELFGAGQAKVGEDVAGAYLYLDAFNPSVRHLSSPLPA